MFYRKFYDGSKPEELIVFNAGPLHTGKVTAVGVDSDTPYIRHLFIDARKRVFDYSHSTN